MCFVICTTIREIRLLVLMRLNLLIIPQACHVGVFQSADDVDALRSFDLQSLNNHAGLVALLEIFYEHLLMIVLLWRFF